MAARAARAALALMLVTAPAHAAASADALLYGALLLPPSAGGAALHVTLSAPAWAVSVLTAARDAAGAHRFAARVPRAAAADAVTVYGAARCADGSPCVFAATARAAAAPSGALELRALAPALWPLAPARAAPPRAPCAPAAFACYPEMANGTAAAVPRAGGEPTAVSPRAGGGLTPLTLEPPRALLDLQVLGAVAVAVLALNAHLLARRRRHAHAAPRAATPAAPRAGARTSINSAGSASTLASTPVQRAASPPAAQRLFTGETYELIAPRRAAARVSVSADAAGLDALLRELALALQTAPAGESALAPRFAAARTV
jgi:hypothetical protein